MLRASLVLLAFFTLLCGLLYPLAVTGAAQAMPVHPAPIGQAFHEPGSLWGRPSAADYDAAASTGSNLGPTNPALLEAVKARIAAYRAADPEATGPVPLDLVTSSASGLDPHVSPAGAEYQVRRIARARHLSEDAVRSAIAHHTEGRTWGLFGEPRVDVLGVNLELAR